MKEKHNAACRASHIKYRERHLREARERYQRDRAALLEWKRDHAAEINHRRRVLRKEQPEVMRARGRAYAAANRERVTAWAHSWRRKNPDRWKSLELKSGSKRRGAPIVELVDVARVMLRDQMVCYLCGLVVTRERLSFDHVIPISKGGSHTEANLAVTHRSCNARKSSKLVAYRP